MTKLYVKDGVLQSCVKMVCDKDGVTKLYVKDVVTEEEAEEEEATRRRRGTRGVQI